MPPYQQVAAASVQDDARNVEQIEEMQNNQEEAGQNFPVQEDQQSQSSSAASDHDPQLNEVTENAFSF